MTLEELQEQFRAAMEPFGHRYTEHILERAKNDLVVKVLVTHYVRTSDPDERSEAMLAMGMTLVSPERVLPK